MKTRVTGHCRGYLWPKGSFFLQVTPDSESDFGNYNCTAVNRVGQESLEFILVQAGKCPCGRLCALR